MNLEKKDHLHRISELTKQLDLAKNTIISLENINVSTDFGGTRERNHLAIVY